VLCSVVECVQLLGYVSLYMLCYFFVMYLFDGGVDVWVV